MIRKRQHTELAPKIEVRRKLLALTPPPLAILETHAGHGDLGRALDYAAAERHTPIDNDRQCTQSINWDSREVLRALNLDAYNFFDIDAYGSPLEWAYLISQRRLAQTPFCLALTCGAFTSRHNVSHDYQRAGFSRQMHDAVGSEAHNPFNGAFRPETHTIPLFHACLRFWFGREYSAFFYSESFAKRKKTLWTFGYFYE